MNKETLVKVSNQVLDLARIESRRSKRGVAAQIDHWARIGSAIESSPGFDYTRVRKALTGMNDAAQLSDDEEAVYFSELGAEDESEEDTQNLLARASDEASR